MTVRSNKPALNLREELSKLNKPSGVAGEAMLRADTPQEQFNLIGAGRKNLIINGDFKVAQRGTSYTRSGGSNYGGFGAMDRWAIYYNGQTLERTENVINGTKKYCAKVTTNDTNTTYLYTNIEAGSKLEGQWVTLSFWMRANRAGVSNGINNMRYYPDATYSPAVAYVDGSSTYSQMKFTTSTDWTYYELPVKLGQDTLGSSDSRNLFVLISPLLNQAGDWFEVADVQLELGKVATPFEHRSYGEELALCQRYCFVLNSPAFLGSGAIAASPSFADRVILDLPATLRATPSLTLTGVLDIYDGTGASTSSTINAFYSMSPSAVSLNITMTSSLTSHRIAYAVLSAGAKLVVDAEL